jgi:hypothetical protein
VHAGVIDCAKTPHAKISTIRPDVTELDIAHDSR